MYISLCIGTRCAKASNHTFASPILALPSVTKSITPQTPAYGSSVSHAILFCAWARLLTHSTDYFRLMLHLVSVAHSHLSPGQAHSHLGIVQGRELLTQGRSYGPISI